MNADATTQQTDGGLAEDLKGTAERLGFDLAGVAPAVRPDGFHELLKWLDEGYAGSMEYIPARKQAYAHPSSVMETVRSVVMLGMNYRTQDPPGAESRAGRISRYAWGDGDYHDLIRDRLKQLAGWLHERVPGCRTRGVVDTAPLLERDFARRAGLGWFGKNTMLIDKRTGSWTFLAALLTDVELAEDAPHHGSHCGTCTLCLEACPTDAFPEPYVLDARRCISYFTIELREGLPPRELREGVGEWLFGCDVCQDVCPWNRKAPVSAEPAFQPREDLYAVDPRELLEMDAEEFRRRFRHTPLWRPGRDGLRRNACLVLGNRGGADSVPVLVRTLGDDSPMVRGAAAWALGRVGGEAAVAALQGRLSVEIDETVREELQQALRETQSIH